jgi:hypothetical protein
MDRKIVIYTIGVLSGVLIYSLVASGVACLPDLPHKERLIPAYNFTRTRRSSGKIYFLWEFQTKLDISGPEFADERDASISASAKFRAAHFQGKIIIFSLYSHLIKGHGDEEAFWNESPLTVIPPPSRQTRK